MFSTVFNYYNFICKWPVFVKITLLFYLQVDLMMTYINNKRTDHHLSDQSTVTIVSTSAMLKTYLWTSCANLDFGNSGKGYKFETLSVGNQ